VYFGVRSEQDIYGAQWLAALAGMHPNLQVHVIVAAGASSVFRIGPVTDAVERDWPSLEGWRAAQVGAPPMVEAATLLVRQKGVLPEHVHADAFYAGAG
jgi:ferredoxin-NAD(P)+ reductase (naphthalene dioxygenase ferredoxin-specific)